MFQYPVFADGADEDPQLFGMVVTGKRPGPPLWKVSNQGNVLWVFGTLDYLPKRLRWDTASVRFILSESEEYISPPRINSIERNPFKAISLMRTFNRIQKPPPTGKLCKMYCLKNCTRASSRSNQTTPQETISSSIFDQRKRQADFLVRRKMRSVYPSTEKSAIDCVALPEDKAPQ